MKKDVNDEQILRPASPILTSELTIRTLALMASTDVALNQGPFEVPDKVTLVMENLRANVEVIRGTAGKADVQVIGGDASHLKDTKVVLDPAANEIRLTQSSRESGSLNFNDVNFGINSSGGFGKTNIFGGGVHIGGRVIIDGVDRTSEFREGAGGALPTLRVTLPTRTDVVARDLRGGVTVDGLEGSLVVEHCYGDVTGRDVVNADIAGSGTGNVRLEKVRGVVRDQSSGTGKLILLNADIDLLDSSRSGVGTIRANGHFAEVRLKNSGTGSISLVGQIGALRGRVSGLVDVQVSGGLSDGISRDSIRHSGASSVSITRHGPYVPPGRTAPVQEVPKREAPAYDFDSSATEVPNDAAPPRSAPTANQATPPSAEMPVGGSFTSILLEHSLRLDVDVLKLHNNPEYGREVGRVLLHEAGRSSESRITTLLIERQAAKRTSENAFRPDVIASAEAQLKELDKQIDSNLELLFLGKVMADPKPIPDEFDGPVKAGMSTAPVNRAVVRSIGASAAVEIETTLTSSEARALRSPDVKQAVQAELLKLVNTGRDVVGLEPITTPPPLDPPALVREI